jgi:hypothetical protein
MKLQFKASAQGGVMNRQQVWKVIGLTLLVCGSLYAQQATITILNAPGAGTGQFQGTFPTAISPARVITGYYLDTNAVYHGFMRSRDGTFTNFDAPGQATRPINTRLKALRPLASTRRW